MGMDIGGAETHIAELSAELVRRGYDIIVASNGGAYVPMLEKSGVRHFVVPMNRRAVIPMVKSLFALRRIIRTERPDIVHAHARIPAFLCSILFRFMHFRFITTTHGVYNSGGIIGKLTSWGERSIAVSEDVKAYLVNSYGIDPDDVFLTVNGIATDRFSPDLSFPDIRPELGIAPSAHIICHVSRLDSASSLTAFKLIEAMPALSGYDSTLTLVIVGGGDVQDEIIRMAQHANKTLSRRAVIITGPRTDIDRILSACDVFVGVSRSALEAMACGKPVVLSGAQGHIGILSPEKIPLATETNFCCRGCALPTAEKLTRDITRLFDYPETRRSFLGCCGRSLVMKYYSVGAMTDSCENAYKALLIKRQKVVMSGYYGFGNAGDEAILQATHDSIRNLGNISVTVLSNNPTFTKVRYGYRTVNRFSLPKVLNALIKCDVLVSGGGSLLQDQTSTRSLLYYISLMRTAKLFGKKVMIYANGIGPVTKSFNRRLVRRIVSLSDAVTLRDSNSADELRAMGVTRKDLIVTADPVFMLRPEMYCEKESLLSFFGIPDEPFIGVSIRKWNCSERLVEQIAVLCDKIYAKLGLNIVFFIMQPKDDTAITMRVRSLMKYPSFLVGGIQDTEDLIGVMSYAELIIAMRLHTLIFSALGSVPTVGITYDPKVSAYLELLGLPSLGSAGDMTAERAFPIVCNALSDRRAISDSLKNKLPELSSLASENVKIFKKLLDSPKHKRI